MTVRIPEYMVWLQQLQLGAKCTLAFINCTNPDQFRLKQAEVVSETDTHLKICFHNGVDTIPVWIDRELGSGAFISTPVFVQQTDAEAIGMDEL